jgi:putative membrane protein
MARKLLVLVVDLDDDISRAGVVAPVVGRSAVLEAATRFALHDPEDSDLNAIFAAVKIADELVLRGYEAVPAIVAGSEKGGSEAALRVREQLEAIVSRDRFDGVVFVSDGSEDETLIPVISSILPIYGVERVVVQQHRGVEETYVLLAKYLKKAFTEPRFSRLFLGIPGVILVVISALALVGMLRQALLIGLLILGFAMTVRGFDLEERLVSLFSETPVSLISYGTAALAVALGIGLLASQLYGGPRSPEEVAAALRGFVGLVGFAAGVAVFGHAVSKLITGGLRPGKELVYITVVVVSIVLMQKIADAISSMQSLSVGEFIAALVEVNFALYVLAAIIVVGIVWRLGRYLDAAFAPPEEKGKEGEASGQTVSAGAGSR